MRFVAFAVCALLTGCGMLGSRIDLSLPFAAAPAVPSGAASASDYPPAAQLPDGSPVQVEPLPRERSVDDLDAPGWSITETELDAQRIQLKLVLARFHTGGDGDARLVVARRGAALARQRGLAGYEILRLEQGVSSGLLFGRRFAEAEIRLIASRSWPAL